MDQSPPPPRPQPPDAFAAEADRPDFRPLAAFIERIQYSEPEAAEAFLDQTAEVSRALLSADSDSYSPAQAYEAIRMLMDASGGGVPAPALALAYRLVGRATESRLIALDGLHARAYRILGQAGADLGTESVTDADTVASEVHDGALDALSVARWCLADEDPVGAAIAAEFNRGLILYAASADRGAAERLLDPPTGPQMQAALSARGRDALVYLLPGDEFSGSAIVVRPGLETDWIRLPRLGAEYLAAFEQVVVGDGSEDEHESGFGHEHDGEQEHEHDAAEAPGRLVEHVCEWAWEAAIEPLLEHLRAGSADGEPFRVVLIPMGELLSVPWHAARYETDGTVHFAVEHLVFSYAASARMFCDSATTKSAVCYGRGYDYGYDEAAMLATTFLGNPAPTVISAQWPVGEVETAILKYMFQHYRCRRGLSSADALRAAQLWMIGDRVPPAAMPVDLSRRLANRDVADVAAWAAFIHIGY